MRSIFLVLGVISSTLLPAASADSISAKLATGFISLPQAGRYWAMSSSYRATFGPDGIQLLRHGRRARIVFPNAELHWKAEGTALAQVNFLGPDGQSFSGTSALRAHEAYPGVDIVLRMQDGQLKSEFQLAAGVSPSLARYCVEGAQVRLGKQGQSLEFDAGDDWRWTEEGLSAWQTGADGARHAVRSRFSLADGCVQFRLGALNPKLPLTIDPDLVFSTYISGGLFDAVTAVATDAQGNVYIGGWTESSDFFIVGPYQGATGGRIDGFVAKVNATGQLQFSTYLGGSSEDRVQAIVIDGAGVITVAGLTNSTNFPTLNPARGTLGGLKDAFVARLYPAGNQLVFSTYLGGAANDSALGLVLDFSGNIVVVGETSSTDFPTQSAYQSTSGGAVDGFLARFAPVGTLLSSTYFGGSADDRIRSVAITGDGTLHVTGATGSSNLPVVAAPFPSLRGAMDAFYTRFNNTASGISLSTYLGGSGGAALNEEGGYGIAIDAIGRAWIAGVTPSTDFPGVSSGYQSTYGGGVSDGFVSVFTAAGALEWSTYIGGTGLDAANAIASGAGFVGVTGHTTSVNLPISGALQTARAGDYDAFWAAFPIVSTTPLYVSYLGGNGSDSAVAAAASGSFLAIAGTTLSTNFPLAYPVQWSNPGAYGGFVSRLRFGPGPVTVSPSSGTNYTQAFQFSVAHATGSTNIQTIEFLFNTSYSFVNGCYFRYDRTANSISLYKDSTSSWLTAILGSGAALNNGSCTTLTNLISTSATANTLTITIPVLFSNTLSGTRNIYANATDNASLSVGWPQVGTWTLVVPAAPTVVTASPSAGSGLTQTFTFPFSDANGATDIATASALFNSGLSTSNGCYFRYSRSANTISLFRDSDNTFLPVTPGSNTTVENTNCSITGVGASVTGSGTQLTMVVPVTFKPNFNGPRTVYSSAIDGSNLNSGWQTVGTWTPVVVIPPTVSGVLPAAGSGPTQTFTVTFSDGNGFPDIANTAILINSATSTSDACYIVYNQTSNTMALFRDSDSAYLPITPGANATIENTNCSISAAGVIINAAGAQLALTIPITFKSTMIGSRNIYAAATDLGGSATGWQTVGSWTPFPVFAPTVVSATPASGGGGTQSFTLTLSDGNGFADIATAGFLFQTSVNTQNGCYVTYSRAANTFSLFRDSDSTFLPVTPGSATMVENANCSITGSAITVTGSGAQLVIVLPIAFKTVFAGTKNFYATTTDTGGLSSGWQAVGNWNPYPAYAPTVVALQPAAGTGLSQSFNFHYSDANGNADIATIAFLFNNSLNTATGCYLSYSRSANTLSLFNPTDSAWLSLSPGSNTTVQNNLCSVSGAGFATTAVANDFYINVAVTFKPALFGNLTMFTIASDQTGLSSGWISAGTWTVNGPAAPSVTSISPNIGAAISQTFTATVYDANGSADITTVQFLVNASSSTANGCYLSYSRAAGTVSLFRDSDAAWLPITLGSAATVSNDYCTLAGTGLTVVPSGNSLALTFPITFKSSFTGAKQTFLNVTDAGGLTSGWALSGTWTLSQPFPPTLTSLTPSSGSAAAQNFTVVISDNNGYADIASALFLLNGSLTGVNGCFISYDRAGNTFFLYRDSDNAWLPITPGASTVVSNAQCSVNGANLSTTFAGNSLTVVLPLTFSGGFSGNKTFYVNATDVGGLTTGWLNAGTWSPSLPVAPTVTSLSPNAGTGLSQTFTLVLSDANGATDISSALFVINTALNGVNSCYISYNRAANALYLYKDSTNIWQLVYPGSSTTVSNSNCSLSGAGLTVTATGSTITLTLPLTFNAAYTGANNFYVYVADNGGLNSGWVTAGTWSSSQPVAPTVTSVTPNSGSGISQTFSVTMSDTNGNADISSALLLVAGTLNGQNACFISYNRGANAFYLFRDSDGAWQLIYPGSSSTVTNGFCTISGTGLASSASGNSLTLSVPLTFTTNFTGSKNFYAYATDAGGLNSGWATLGTWSAAPAAPPTVTSITPSSGSGASQNFTLTLTDTNGNADIASALILINSSLNGNNACFLSYNRAVNAFYLLRDSDGAWQPLYPGSASSVTNTNCTLTGTNLAATASGNTLTLTLPLSFKPAFAGAKNVYASVTDAGGLSSGVVTPGTWTVN